MLVVTSFPSTATHTDTLAPPLMFSCGVIAGFLASITTQPADVVKTGVQLQAANSGLVQTVLSISQRAGVRGMFAGILPRVTRRTLMAAFTWSFYEQVCPPTYPPFLSPLLLLFSQSYYTISPLSLQIVLLVENRFDRFPWSLNKDCFMNQIDLYTPTCSSFGRLPLAISHISKCLYVLDIPSSLYSWLLTLQSFSDYKSSVQIRLYCLQTASTQRLSPSQLSFSLFISSLYSVSLWHISSLDLVFHFWTQFVLRIVHIAVFLQLFKKINLYYMCTNFPPTQNYKRLLLIKSRNATPWGVTSGDVSIPNYYHAC